MTTAIANPTKTKPPENKPSALNLMASRLSCDPAKLLATLKATVFKGANDEEVMALCLVANEYHLNPLLKEMYAFPAKGGGIVPVVSVDGWNKMLLRQPQYDGKKFTFERAEDGHPISCTATIFVKGRDHAEEITEYFDECQRNTDNWKNMPHRMLRNRTLCQASRMAFGFSGVYHEEEIGSIVVESTVMPAELPPKMVAAPSGTGPTPQAELESLVLGAGFDLNHVQKFGADSGNITNADSLTAFSEIPTDEAKRLLKNKTGFLAALKNHQG
jgi:phage recombination protein Bet